MAYISNIRYSLHVYHGPNNSFRRFYRNIFGEFSEYKKLWLAKFLLLRLENLTLFCLPLKDEQHALKTNSHSGQIVELQHHMMHRGRKRLVTGVAVKQKNHLC